MVYHERAAWAQLIASILTIGAYAWLMLTNPDPTTSWVPIMLWTISIGIVVSILITILWGIAVGLRDKESATASDMRDTDISRLGGRVEHAFLIVAALAVIVLCALESDVFWVAQAMFAGFAISSLLGGITRVIAYRRGLA